MHLYWQKPRRTTLGPRVEGLPDDRPSKPLCLFRLAQLFEFIADHAERKWLLNHSLELWREQGNDERVALTLGELSDANRGLGFFEEGIQRAKDGLEINRQLGDTRGQAECSNDLAWLLWEDGQLDAAEEAASRAIELLPEKGEELLACKTHRILGDIHHSKGEREKVVHHFSVARRIASHFEWHSQLFWIHRALADLFSSQGEFGDALHVQIGRAESHAANHVYYMGRAMELQARIWYKQHRLQEARSEGLHALETFEKLGTEIDLAACRALLQDIELDFGGGFLEIIPLCMSPSSPFLPHSQLSLAYSPLTHALQVKFLDFRLP